MRIFMFFVWTIGGGWRLLEGCKEGQTQTDSPMAGGTAYFNHPIDVHLSTKSLQNWPSIRMEVYHFDAFGRQELFGYGSCTVPTSPGEHEIDCATWRPTGTYREEVARKFVGGGFQLRNPDTIFSTADRHRLTTTSAGTVSLRLGILTRNFDKFGIEF